jgi:hypothetical protein
MAPFRRGSDEIPLWGHTPAVLLTAREGPLSGVKS